MNDIIDGIDDYKLLPIFASSEIFISSDGQFRQIIIYDYYEPTGMYFNDIQADNDFYRSELELIAGNMQNFLDKIDHRVNGKRVYPKIIDVDIDFKDDTMPFFVWVIAFKANFREDNIYSAEFEEEKLGYNISALYIFSEGLEPYEVRTSLEYTLIPETGLIKYWGTEGGKIGPEEIIKFRKN